MERLFLALVLVLVTSSFKGEVVSVDVSARTLMVKVKDKGVTLNVTDETRIMFGKEKEGLAEIKAGDEITAWTGQKDGKTIAKSIWVSTSKSASAAKSGIRKINKSPQYSARQFFNNGG